MNPIRTNLMYLTQTLFLIQRASMTEMQDYIYMRGAHSTIYSHNLASSSFRIFHLKSLLNCIATIHTIVYDYTDTQ